MNYSQQYQALQQDLVNLHERIDLYKSHKLDVRPIKSKISDLEFRLETIKRDMSKVII